MPSSTYEHCLLLELMPRSHSLLCLCNRLPYLICGLSVGCCRVLRLREGAPLEVCDGNGTIAAAILKGIGHRHRAYVETSQPAKTVRSPYCAPIALQILGAVFGRVEPPQTNFQCRITADTMAWAKMGDCGSMLQSKGRPRRLPHGEGC